MCTRRWMGKIVCQRAAGLDHSRVHRDRERVLLVRGGVWGEEWLSLQKSPDPHRAVCAGRKPGTHAPALPCRGLFGQKVNESLTRSED